MMPETVAELAGGLSVSAGVLFEFEFLSRTMRFWDGLRDLKTNDDRVWQASGSVISASGLEHRPNMGASPATFSMSGVQSELIQFAAGSQQEVVGRPCAVFIQFLSSALVPLDSPVAIWAGNMDTLSFRAGAGSQSITLTAESLFVNRIRAPHSFMTSRDQQARYPGDTGMNLMPALINKSVTWLRG